MKTAADPTMTAPTTDAEIIDRLRAADLFQHLDPTLQAQLLKDTAPPKQRRPAAARASWRLERLRALKEQAVEVREGVEELDLPYWVADMSNVINDLSYAIEKAG
jgi:hypothetical protein